MNKILAILVLLAGMLSGCASFGDTSDAGDWYFFMGREAFVAHQQDQLAIAKLTNSPISAENALCTGSIGNTVTTSQGYRGTFFNKAKGPRNIVCSGPERRSFYLEPINEDGDMKDACLIPGIYECASYDMRGREVFRGKFRSGPQQHDGPTGRKFYWYYIVGR